MKTKTSNTRKARHFLYALLALVLSVGCETRQTKLYKEVTILANKSTEYSHKSINATLNYKFTEADSLINLAKVYKTKADSVMALAN